VDKDDGRQFLSNAMDDEPKQSPTVVSASMDRLSRDLGRRAEQRHTATDIRDSGNIASAFADHCNRRQTIQLDSGRSWKQFTIGRDRRITSPELAGAFYYSMIGATFFSIIYVPVLFYD
jgi:hypothetical protein